MPHVCAIVILIAIVIVIGRRLVLCKRDTTPETTENAYEGSDGGLNAKRMDAKDEGEHQGVGAGNAVMGKLPRREVTAFWVAHRKAIVGAAIS